MQKRLKILVVRFSSIGDIVLTTPIVRMLKKQLNSEVHFLTKQVNGDLVINNPYIDTVIIFKDSISEVIDKLKNENYDYVIDLHNNIRTRILKFQLGIKSRSFPKINLLKFLMTQFKRNYLPKIHIVDRYLETIKFLGIKNDMQGLDFFLSTDDKVQLSVYPKKFIAFVIGGQYSTKILPINKIISICNKINNDVILIGGPNDSLRGKEIEKKCNSVISTCGDFTVMQSAFLIKNSQYVITHDTGMMHIASAFCKKIFSVWGNTIPEFGMYPYMAHEDSRIIEVKGLNCRPCSKIGFSKCPKGHFKCMEEINENLFLSK